MKNIHLAKTLTASLPGDAQAIFARISDPENLSSWHASFCRSLRRQNGALIAETPRGSVPVRFIRNDHTLVLDLLIEVAEGIELANAIRVLPNGEISEIVWTIVKPQGLSDSAFHEQLRWAGSALHALRKMPLASLPSGREKAGMGVTAVNIDHPPQSASTKGEEAESQPLQAPSPAEISSMPLSGKKLFVGNLSYVWTDDELRAHFTETGTVSTAEVARFRGRGGRSRGFGFVEMATEAEAQTAIEKLHGGMAGGRQIIVRLAKSQEKRSTSEVRSHSEESPSDLGPRTSDQALPEPGNERTSSIGRPRGDRPKRGGTPQRRPDRGAVPRRLGGGRARPAGTERSYQEQDISNKSGYEIFPRRSAGSPEINHSSASTPSRPSLEASPYMDDTGDIENHDHRPPRHRRRR